MLSSNEDKQIPLSPKSAPVRLQAAQHSMLVFKQYNPSVSTYHHTVALSLEGPLNISILKDTLKQLMKRHEALRSELDLTGFLVDKNFKDAPLTLLECQDSSLSNMELKQTLPLLKKLKQADLLEQPFELKNSPLWRAILIKHSEKQFKLVFVFDHIIFDVASQNVFLQELGITYNALADKQTPILPELPHLAEIKSQKNDFQNKLEYWKKNLEDLSPPKIHTEKALSKSAVFKGNRIGINFKAEEINNFQALLNSYNTTLQVGEPKISLHMFFLATLYVLLYRYTSSTDLCIGTASANRRDYNVGEEKLKGVINCFVNSIPLRADLADKPNFLELLKQVKKVAINAYQNQIPLNEIISEAWKASNNVATPFDIIFVLNDVKTKPALKGITVSDPIELNLGNSKFQHFGLNLDRQSDGCIKGFIEYNSDLFPSKTIQALLGHWFNILHAILKTPTANIADLPMLLPLEVAQINNYNQTEQPLLVDEDIHELVRKKVQTTPQNTAVVFHTDLNSQNKVTWEEINSEIDAIAQALISNSIKPNDLVGVCVTRSPRMISALLGVHRAGAGFVPLDTTPGQSLNSKVKTAELTVILVDEKTDSIFPSDSKVKLINIDKKLPLFEIKENKEAQKPNINNKACVYFTSGSSGEPKGVEVTFANQRVLTNALARRNLPLNAKFLCVADIKSDAIWFDITQWVVNQKPTLHIINDAERFDAEALTRYIQKQEMTHLVLLPHIMARLNPKDLPSVKVAITMGAAPDGKMLKEWQDCGIEVHNEWGPTENTVCSTTNICKPGDPPTAIGTPISNVQIFIVNPDGCINPPMVPGEVIVKGKSLASYFKNPELNKKFFPRVMYDSNTHRFKPIPENKELSESDAKLPQMTIYKTGDKAYFDSELNTIVFLGRIDNQIKIKGIRIELDALKLILMAHKSISDIVVVKHPSKESLIAYIVPKESTENLNTGQLLKSLNDMLISSSLPAVARLGNLVCLPKLPLKSAGKVDTSALPLPSDEEAKTFVAPTSLLEAELRKLWSRILQDVNPETLGTDVSFSTLGGISVSLARMLNIINKPAEDEQPKEFPFEFNVLLCPKHIAPYYADVTIKQLAEILTKHLSDKNTNHPNRYGFMTKDGATPDAKTGPTPVRLTT